MKRVWDFSVTLVCLVVLAPLMLCIAVTVFVSLGRPVLFRQRRPGLHGRPFTLIKFRTMQVWDGSTDGSDGDSERLTPLGRFLRNTSLDELPELYNVLRGDMSLVGPRPLLMEYLALYTPEQSRRHAVRPGITGWAQVNGRNAIDWEKKFALDVWYVDNRSFLLDLKILLMTVAKVLRREGVAQQGHATVEKFKGTWTDQS